MRIDSHQHFWSYSDVEYPWIPQGSPLHRDWLPADLEAIHRSMGFAGSIAVQARQSLAESHWLLELAARHPSVLGVVGWVDLRDPQCSVPLAELAANPRFVGVRHVAQDEPDAAFLARPEFVNGVKALSEFGLTYDILIYPRQLPAAIELARACPEQPFVLDHIAKPCIRAGEFETWIALFRELGSLPNVHCKLSGMVTEADNGAPDSAFLPYVRATLDVFGIERVMFGSDWPVCLLAASYERVLEIATNTLARCGVSGDGLAAIMGGNAERFYLSRTPRG